MGERIKLLLISLWLFISFPFNVATLKHLIRYVCLLAFQLDAGLGKHLWLQYLLAFIFVSWVIVLLLRQMRWGRTLAIILLLGSCCEVMGLFLIDLVYLFTIPHVWLHPFGMMVVVFIFLLNLACLFVLGKRGKPSTR